MAGTEPLTPYEPVAWDTAFEAARTRIRVAAAMDPDDSVGPVAAGTAGQHRVIHDLNGLPLFHDVDVMDDSAQIGVVRVAASATIGSALISVETQPRRWDPEGVLDRAPRAALSLHPGATVRDTRLVLYCYPKVAVRVSLDLPDAPGQRDVLLDASDLSPVVGIGEEGIEGSGAYSFYAEIVEPERDARLRRFRYDLANVDLLRAAASQLFDPRFQPSPALTAKLAALANNLLSVQESRVLPYSPRCTQAENFELRAQQTSVYCAVACGQMILDWHRWYYTQNQIAVAMNTGPLGTTDPNQLAGYKALTNSAFTAVTDTSPDWAEAKTEIDAGRPVKSGVPDHARACNGYRKILNFATSGYQRELRIYDPWPFTADPCQGGAVYWEDWNAISHTNWTYVRHA